MMEFIQIVLIIYILYYAGNIIYDIFLKKESQKLDEENTEEFSFGLGEESRVQNIQMEDVEQMTTTAKFEADENDIFGSDDDFSDNLDDLEQKYNQEMELEAENNQKNNQNQEQNDENQVRGIENEVRSNEDEHNTENKEEIEENSENNGGENSEKNINKEEIIKRNKAFFKELMNKAETKVQVIISEDGEKIYRFQK